MIFCDWNSKSLHENLAIDEAILMAALELQSNGLNECLRLWEMPSQCVVMGRGSKSREVNLPACENDKVPVLRRCSGGAPIVAGPGCLMFSLVLSLEKQPNLRSIDVAHQWVMTRVAQAVQSVSHTPILIQGSCDLTIGDKKFSGNAVRYSRDWILYHGTLLYRFPLETVSRYLNMPVRQPAYRAQRSHDQFITNIPSERRSLETALISQWNADGNWYDSLLMHATERHTQQLLQSKYS